MKYDFDSITPRRNTCSYKWDTPESTDVLPMWVADMDFPTAPAIISALMQRVAHGIFGYTKVPDDYYSAVTQWFASRHNFHIDPEWIIYTSGVVPALSAIIKAMSVPGDKIITQTPAYNCFFSSIRNNGCELLENRLTYHNGNYSIDFDDLERKASDPQAKIMLLCNPHNPSGRVWTPDELRKIGDISLKHGLFVISDEIHCELTFDSHIYTPYSSLGEKYLRNSATCVSPSKAFNIAGLQIANIIASDSDIRSRIDKAININEVCDVNPFGIVASIAAYNDSAEWLEELKAYLWNNYCHLRTELELHAPMLKVIPLQGTYLAWVDITALRIPSAIMADRLLEEEHLMINPGTMYGPGGEGFIRINLASPRALIADAASRIIRFTTSYMQSDTGK